MNGGIYSCRIKISALLKFFWSRFHSLFALPFADFVYSMAVKSKCNKAIEDLGSLKGFQKVNNFSVKYQLVDFRANQSRDGGKVDEAGLIAEFQKFPFASELDRADSLKGDITLPTLTFKRERDGEEVGIWTEDAAGFDLCLVSGSKKKFLRSLTAEEVEDVLAQFKTKSVLEIELKREDAAEPSEGGAPKPGQGVVFYNSQWRWLHIICLSFAVGGIYLAVSDQGRKSFGNYIVIAFCSLFSLFFIRGALFGFRVRLASDGRSLRWQEGRKKGSVKLTSIAAISIDYSPPKPGKNLDIALVTLQLSNGHDIELPINLGNQVLRARNWRMLRELAAYVQKFSPTVRVNPGKSDYDKSEKK